MWFIPTIERLGEAKLACALGIPLKNVRRWIDLDSIPAEWFAPIARAALALGQPDISVEFLADQAEARRLHRSALKSGTRSEARA